MPRSAPRLSAVAGALVAIALLAVGARGAKAQRPDRAPPAADPTWATPMEVVVAMLEIARVGRGDLVYDLGCGDGRIVITAVRRFGAGGVCVELDSAQIAGARRNADTAGVEERVRFVQGDLFQVDLRGATVVTLYLPPALTRRLRPKLLRELRPGTRVVSHEFDLGDWRPDSVAEVRGTGGVTHSVRAWVLPTDVAGTWEVVVGGDAAIDRSAPRYRLHLTQRFQHITGSVEAAGRSLRLRRVRLAGDRLEFELTEQQGERRTTRRFSGRVREDAASGRLVETGSGASRQWSATRVSRTSARGSGPGGGAGGAPAGR